MTKPNPLTLTGRVGLILFVALLSACAPLPPAPGGPGQLPSRWLGRITSIEGPNAFVDPGNSGAGRPAHLGQTLLGGDRFYTGPGTHMKIDFANGGSVELDENTDPSLFQDLGCLVVSLFRSGRIFVDKAAACVDSLDTRSQQFSKVVYAVMPSGPYLQITVVEGQARTLRPAVATVPAGWRIDVNSRRILGGGRAYQVSDEEIRRSIVWTQYYRSVPGRGTRNGLVPELPFFPPRGSGPSEPRPGDASGAPRPPAVTPPSAPTPPTTDPRRPIQRYPGVLTPPPPVIR